MATDMEALIKARTRLLDELDASVTEAESWFKNILDTLNWTKQHLLQENTELVTCPFDSNHIMPASSLAEHVKYCSNVAKGYTREELKREEERTSKPFYEKASNVVSVDIDEETHREVIEKARKQRRSDDSAHRDSSYSRSRNPEPERIEPDDSAHHGSSYRRSRGPEPDRIEPDTSTGEPEPSTSSGTSMPLTLERAMADMAPTERAALYEYIVWKAKEINPHPSVTEEELLTMIDLKTKEEKDKAKSYLEQVAEERDHKRRRQTYRAKNVHITRKSYTDIMREVISNQTENLSQKWEDENERIVVTVKHKNDQEDGSDEDSKYRNPAHSKWDSDNDSSKDVDYRSHKDVDERSYKDSAERKYKDSDDRRYRPAEEQKYRDGEVRRFKERESDDTRYRDSETDDRRYKEKDEESKKYSSRDREDSRSKERSRDRKDRYTDRDDRESSRREHSEKRDRSRSRDRDSRYDDRRSKKEASSSRTTESSRERRREGSEERSYKRYKDRN